MNEKDLIEARVATQELLVKTIRQFGMSIVALLFCAMVSTLFNADVGYKIFLIVTTLGGMTFGIMIGAMRAYNIFWEKKEFESEKL